uniref:Uncharacterized protein n=1 Tax=Anguilla anguilla TaxID=7936 RepID=A0A0E9WJ38_ANGAN
MTFRGRAHKGHGAVASPKITPPSVPNAGASSRDSAGIFTHSTRRKERQQQKKDTHNNIIKITLKMKEVIIRLVTCPVFK